MTVQELLKQTDINEMVRLTIADRPYYEKKLDAEKVRLSYVKFVELLLSLRPEVSNSKIIVFEKYWDTIFVDDENEKISEYIGAECYDTNELRQCLNKFESFDYKIEFNENDNGEQLEQLCTKFPMSPISYGFEFTKWEHVLGWDVYEGNIQELGVQNCIYALLYEMSFNGMDRESQEERKAELEQSVAESEAIFAMPEEERAKHLFSFDEVKQHLKDEFGWEEPSPEERAEEIRKMWLCSLKTLVWKFENYRQMLSSLELL